MSRYLFSITQLTGDIKRLEVDAATYIGAWLSAISALGNKMSSVRTIDFIRITKQ